MISNSGNFWELLQRSKILPAELVPSLAARYQSHVSAGRSDTKSTDPDKPHSLSPARWMVAEKVLTEFQVEVIGSGFGERLRYANYTIYEPLDKGVDRYGTPWTTFKAIHQPTGHRLLLFFVDGESDRSEASWIAASESAANWQKLKAEDVLPVLDILKMSEHRFIVCDSMDGDLLANKIPENTRLSSQKSMRQAKNILEIIDALHSKGVVHGELSMESFVVDGQGAVRILPPFLCHKNPDSPHSLDSANKDGDIMDSEPKHPKTNTRKDKEYVDYVAPEVLADPRLKVAASDTFSFGVILHRLLSGKLPRLSKKSDKNLSIELADPKKMGYAPEFNQLIKKLLVTDSAQRLSDINTINEVLIKHNSEKERPKTQYIPNQSLIEFREWMVKWRPDSDASAIDSMSSKPDGPKPNELNVASQHFVPQTESERTRDRRNPSGNFRRQLLMTSLISAIVLAVITAFTYFGVQIGKSISATKTANISSNDSLSNGKAKDSQFPNSNDYSDKNSGGSNNIDSGGAYLIQNVTDDDGELPWQSPTTQPPDEFQLVPPSPQLILSIRLADVMKNAEGNLIVQSLGPIVKQFLDTLPSRIGFAAQEIESLTVSLHSNSGSYDFVFRAQLVEGLDEPALVDRWPNAKPEISESGNAYYSQGDLALFYASVQEGEKIDTFVSGPTTILSPVIESNGVSRIDGVLRELGARTDRARHLNLLFLRSALSSDEGQQIITGPWARLNRAIATRMDDRVRGVLASAHFDQGMYLELQLENAVDFKVQDCKDFLEQQFADARDQIDTAVSSTVGHPYWEKVRIRYDDMISMLIRNTRVGIEGQQVIANCWLPEMAGHNLIAATEIALTAIGDQPLVSNSVQPTVTPKTIEELLLTKRDLVDSNPPDLNVLIENLKNEIKNDFPNLPFEFEIVVIGKDLEEDGITRNQRPTELNLKQLSIAEILTKVMFLANPEKNATSPADPLCKLVWVIDPDSENPSKRTILITTRNAAKKKSFQLPPAFQEKE